MWRGVDPDVELYGSGVAWEATHELEGGHPTSVAAEDGKEAGMELFFILYCKTICK